MRNSLLGGDAKIMSRSFIAFSTLGGWRYKIGALKGDTNLLLLVVTLLVSWNVTNSHPNSAGGRYSSGMSIFFFRIPPLIGVHWGWIIDCFFWHVTLQKEKEKKRPHQSTLLCVKKNKAGGGERVVSENDLGYLMSWPCQWFTNSTLIICWSLSFIDFAEDTWHIIPRLPIKQMLTHTTRTICGLSISMVKWGRCIKGRIWSIERMWQLVKHRWARW